MVASLHWRVIDNATISLSAAEFWVHLNYHLIHLLDFLPAALWQLQANDILLMKFVEVHDFLCDMGKKVAVVDYDAASSEPQADEMPLTLGKLIYKIAPRPLLVKMAQKEVKRWSCDVGHSLEFSLRWA